MAATSPSLEIEGKPGYLFASTLGVGVCFVPEECVDERGEGDAEIDHAKYVVGGWAKKNAVFNPSARAHRLFANPHNRMNGTEPTAAEFIHRHLEASQRS